MPIYVYECPRGHKFDRVVIRPTANEPVEKVVCEHRAAPGHNGMPHDCNRVATLIPSRTGTPILKAGVGGFFKPNAR